ncbi:class I SAM-dependent methyltransferase [Microbacterium algeriense]|uniref:class I SAM-dependent methyltransferase n=1 Tax=Microbacterium algeriense TaxID=2615184 RepID=UPI0022E08DCB|nr:class I SAM-dependent methyltransferase [Microbacterium algeriense]
MTESNEMSSATRRVRESYSARADEYTALFGEVAQMDAVDRDRIASWAQRIRGPILDAGCGPGHWTAFLADRGHEVEGVDLVPEFVEAAIRRHPHLSYRVGSLSDPVIAEASLGGVLAWYSLIHADAEELPVLLRAIRRGLKEGGELLVGFFDGPDGEPFPHAVTTAYYWSVDGMARLLEREGFAVVDSDARVQDGRRPHASLSAVAV